MRAEMGLIQGEVCVGPDLCFVFLYSRRAVVVPTEVEGASPSHISLAIRVRFCRRVQCTASACVDPAGLI